MSALLLTLHLWQAPMLPVSATQLHLLSAPRLAWLAAEPTPTLTPTEPAVDGLTLRLGEIGAGAGAYLLSQALVAGIIAGLVLGVDALGSSNALSIGMIILGFVLGTADLLAGPLAFAWGTQWAAGALNEPSVNFGHGVVGGYLGGSVGIALAVIIVVVEASVWPTSGNSSGSGLNSISPLGYTGIIAGLLLPLGGGIGASIGQHLGEEPAVTHEPAGVAPTSPSNPFDSLPPPSASAPPRAPSLRTVNLVCLRFD